MVNSFSMPVSHLYIVFGEISIQVFCQFIVGVVFFFLMFETLACFGY